MSSCNVLQVFQSCICFLQKLSPQPAVSAFLELPEKHGAQKARTLSVQHRYLLLCSLSIHSLDQRACDTNPELLVQWCTTRKQFSDDLRQPLLPTHKNRTSVSIPMKCWIHPRFETRNASFFARPDHCCLSWLIWLTLLLFNDCAQKMCFLRVTFKK